MPMRRTRVTVVACDEVRNVGRAVGRSLQMCSISSGIRILLSVSFRTGIN
jgi:hypothetical protein